MSKLYVEEINVTTKEKKIVEMPPDEVARREAVTAASKARLDAEAAKEASRVAARARATTKLLALGLSQEEIDTL